MIQSISNSSAKLDSVQAQSLQTTKTTAKCSNSAGLSAFSKSTQDILFKETVNLIIGIAVDVLRAAISSLIQQTSPAVETPVTQTPSTNTTTTPPSTTTQTSTQAVTPTTVESVPTPAAAVPPTEASPPRKNEGLSSFLQRELKPNKDGNFHEEQLQYGVVGYLLNEKSPELSAQFETAYSEYKSKTGSKSSYEDGVKAGLKSLVAANKLSKSEAEDINGKSYRAAQLDKDLTTLFDDKGGNGDNTIAVLSAKVASEKVDRAYGRIRRGELAAAPRSLDAPSNTKPKSLSVKSASASMSGFLWKPVSESDSKLAILTPASIAQNVESVSIYKVDSSGKKSLVENGRSVGIANEGRATFRFRLPGAQYPDGAVVEIKLKNGEIVSETINETSARVEKA